MIKSFDRSKLVPGNLAHINAVAKGKVVNIIGTEVFYEI